VGRGTFLQGKCPISQRSLHTRMTYINQSLGDGQTTWEENVSWSTTPWPWPNFVTRMLMRVMFAVAFCLWIKHFHSPTKSSLTFRFNSRKLSLSLSLSLCVCVCVCVSLSLRVYVSYHWRLMEKENTQFYSTLNLHTGSFTADESGSSRERQTAATVSRCIRDARSHSSLERNLF